MSVADEARELVAQLKAFRTRMVLAESCTGGLVSAELAKVPGVSDWYCGSMVTYRCDSKVRWLGVDAAAIERHTAVSGEVAEAMARGVLSKTPEADLAASITGHFGPHAPEGFDGLVFVGTARRRGETIMGISSRHQLVTHGREERQQEAAGLVLNVLTKMLDVD